MYSVVICEDEDIIRKGLMYSFDFYGLDLVVVADFDDPVSCLDYIKTHKIDIIITDIKMPLMSGLEMIKNIDNRKQYEFIILSGYSDFDYAKKAISLGVTEYLVKPIDHKLLKNSLKKAISNLNDKQLINNAKFQVKNLSKVYQDVDKDDKLLQEIILFIKNNYMNKITLTDVATELSYSVSSIKNKLKQNRITFNTTLKIGRAHV